MKRIAKRLLAAVAAGMLMIGGFAAQASAEQPVPPEDSWVAGDRDYPEIPGANIWLEGCTIRVQVEIPDPGDYYFNVWDDGKVIDDYNFKTVVQDQVVTYDFLILASFEGERDGIGIVLYDDMDRIQDWDPWDFDTSDLVTASCEASGGVDNGVVDARVLEDKDAGVEVVVPWACAAREVKAVALDDAAETPLLGADYDVAKSQLYDIRLYDRDGDEFNEQCEAPMVLRVAAPADFDEFVLVGDAGVEKLEYKLEDGSAVVRVEHFSIYGFAKRAAAKVPDKKPVTPKPVTPKPVTPKPVTPKPVTPKPTLPKTGV